MKACSLKKENFTYLQSGFISKALCCELQGLRMNHTSQDVRFWNLGGESKSPLSKSKIKNQTPPSKVCFFLKYRVSVFSAGNSVTKDRLKTEQQTEVY